MTVRKWLTQISGFKMKRKKNLNYLKWPFSWIDDCSLFLSSLNVFKRLNKTLNLNVANIYTKYIHSIIYAVICCSKCAFFTLDVLTILQLTDLRKRFNFGLSGVFVLPLGVAGWIKWPSIWFLHEHQYQQPLK